MLTLSDIEHILSFYDLGELYGMTQSYRGFVNETTFIQTSSGKYVVRRNHRRLGSTAHEYRHALIQRLVDHDFPTAAPVPQHNGETLLQLDGRFYEIFTFVTGSDYDPQRPRQLDSIGATLARYHRIVEPWQTPPDSSPPRYVPLNIMSQVEQLLVRDVMGELFIPLGWYSNRAAQLRQVLTDKSYAALPHYVIHGDIHRDNLLFSGDEVSALLDFDQVTWDARLVDLADALVGFATSRKSTGKPLSWGVFTGPLDAESSARLLAAYAEIFPVSPEEIQMLPPMIEVLWMQSELGRVISTPEGAPEYHESVLEQGRELSDWMREHSKELTTHWNETCAEPSMGKHKRSPALAA